ncbi:MAG: metal-dependent transcriptional regulator [Chloroflexota bacterium]|nr:metal-dependent transcriptional regulator [Chloroflexota bacterium]
MTRRNMPAGSSQSVEDFLKAVYRLQRESDRVSTSALAVALDISAPAVTDMAQRLMEDGRVDYLKYRGVRLTAEGERVALKMLRRHRLIEAYLVQDLGYQLHEVHDEAEALEHTVSDRFVEAISRKLNNPRYDPHGDPIPDLKGVMPVRELQPLSQLALKTPARIRRLVMDDSAMLRDTQVRGLEIGRTLEVVARDEFDGPIQVVVEPRNAQTIGFKMASFILVEFV